ncbi:MAG: DUF4184 family protein [Pirellulaceae bacterium]|nr:DUF4184 family protein [Pirellulaceae bacterium]
MPFTPTHILAVLPLAPLYRWLPFPALAIGAMVPDIGLFYPSVDYAKTHSPQGVFTTCIPLGIALFILFETLVRRPLVALLPNWYQSRIDPRPQLSTKPTLMHQVLVYASIAAAVGFGAFSHQIWDAFTHQGRWGTQLLPWLNVEVSLGGYSAPGFKLLQYSSTLVGLPLLAVYSHVCLWRASPQHALPKSALSNRFKLIASVIVLSIPILVGTYACATQSTYPDVLGVTIKVSGAIVGVLCVAYCIGFQLCNERTRN